MARPIRSALNEFNDAYCKTHPWLAQKVFTTSAHATVSEVSAGALLSKALSMRGEMPSECLHDVHVTNAKTGCDISMMPLTSTLHYLLPPVDLEDRCVVVGCRVLPCWGQRKMFELSLVQGAVMCIMIADLCTYTSVSCVGTRFPVTCSSPPSPTTTPPLTYYYPYSSPYLPLPLLIPLPTTTPTPPLTYYNLY